MIARLPIAALAATALLASAASPARAGFTIYTDQANFLAALDPNTFVDTYNDLPGGDLAQQIDRSGNGFSYTANNIPADGRLFGVGAAADRWLSTFFADPDAIVYDNFGGSPTAVGGFFFTTDAPGEFLPGQSITVTVTGSDGTLTETLTDVTPDTFFGVVGTGPVAKFRVVVAAQPEDGAWQTVNDFIVGRGAPSGAVPAPTGLPLGLVGAATFGLGLIRRRRA